MLKRIELLFHTLRFLKPIQLYWRFYLKFIRLFPFSMAVKEDVATKSLFLVPPINKPVCLDEEQFCFLNRSGSSRLPVVWNDNQADKLWLYNLHYFDFINQGEIEDAVALELIHDWIKSNPVGQGNGWEPYPLSLRIVNWIKFFSCPESSELTLNNRTLESLYLQCRYLARNLEFHLLGNHLFKNGVALMFAGNYFDGREADSWLCKGMRLVMEQIEEQVLADGGHFERSPMYHVLILEDILDCLNLQRSSGCFTSSDVSLIEDKATAMLRFLADILHPDGEIPFFNDCALAIAPRPESVFRYARRLGLEGLSSMHSGQCAVVEKPEFGLYVLKNKSAELILDAGAIGPDYLPGHAHCDTLSYELSLHGRRCIVNSGTYQYAGDLRNHFRATRAHNTVVIDGAEQHEIWSTFRVARRGYPSVVTIRRDDEGSLAITASHSGYQRLPGAPEHQRRVLFRDNGLTVTDTITGQGEHQAESYLHLHPDVELIDHCSSSVLCKLGDSDFSICVGEGGRLDLEPGWFSPEFGLKLETKVLVLRRREHTPMILQYTIDY